MAILAGRQKAVSVHRRWAMAVRLEHANLIVRDINGMIRFLQTAFPEFKVRGEGKSRDGSRWVHVGTNETYIALSPAKEEPEKHWIPLVLAPPKFTRAWDRHCYGINCNAP
jgi:hypothetical protein